jgi:hypothetical protein
MRQGKDTVTRCAQWADGPLGRVLAGDHVAPVDLLGPPAQLRHAVLDRAGVERFRLPASRQGLDMLRPETRCPQLFESCLVQLIRDQLHNAHTVGLRAEAAVSVAVAELLQVVVQYTLSIDQPQIGLESLWLPDADPAEVRVQRVEQIIEFRRNDRARHRERCGRLLSCPF